MTELAPPARFEFPAQAIGGKRLSEFEKGILFVYFFSFAFDFRSENSGGQLAHYVFLLLSQASFVLFAIVVLLRKKVRGVYDINRFPAILIVAITLYSPIVAIYRDVPQLILMPLELRYVLLTQSMLLIYLIARIGADFEYIMRLVLISGIVSLIWNAYHLLDIKDYELKYLRYRIAPLHIIGVIAVGYGVFFGKHLIYSIPLLLSLFLIQLSNTRSHLGMFLIAFLVLHLLALLIRKKSILLRFLLVDIAAIPVVFLLFLRGAFDNWLYRFTEGATGVGQATWLSRLAEYLSQWEILTSSLNNLIFGAGLGATFYRDLTVLRYAVLSGHFGVDDYANQDLGHSLYFYSVFSGGLAAGWIIPLLVLAALVASFRNVLRSARRKDTRRMIMDVQCHAYILMVAAVGLLSHPFSSRLLCLHMGAILAITYIYPKLQDGRNGG